MKKNCIYIAILSLFFLLPSCNFNGRAGKSYQPHIGVWEERGILEKKAVLVLREDGSGSIWFDNLRHDFSYIIDYSKRPVNLDLLYRREGKPFRARLIVKFLGMNRFKWRSFYNEKRPTRFLPEKDGHTVILNRSLPYV
jgi:hypothetical protein